MTFMLSYFHNFIASYCSMSAIDFYCSVDKVQGADGKDRVVVTFDGKYLPHTEQVCVFLFLPVALFLESSWCLCACYQHQLQFLSDINI